MTYSHPSQKFSVPGGDSDAVVDAILKYVLNNAEIRRKYDPLCIDSVPFDGGSANNVI